MRLICRLLVILSATLVMAGCEKPKPKPIPNTLHVKAAVACAEVITGTFEGREFSLAPIRGKAQLGVACYQPIRPEDVGKDFKARIENDTMLVEIPDMGVVSYSIEAARE